MSKYLDIEIDYSRDSLFDELGLARLKDSYMKEDETSPQERYAYVSKEFGSDVNHSQRLYDYASNHWLSFSTPILSFGKSKRGLPISCFLNFLDDTSDSLINTWSETNRLSMAGGGVGVHVKLRSSDDKSVGVMPHLKTYDTASLAYRQGQTRRGSYAMYLDINHPDILQFLELRKATGDPNIRCQNLHHGINVSDDFMSIIERCIEDPTHSDAFDLVDPNSKRVVETVSAKELWQRILEIRLQTGEPYLHFIDTANRALPQHLKDQNLSIHGSNLCAEIELPTSVDRTAVCCLSSLNLDYYDDWKDNYQFIKDVAEMLDNVLQYFIDNCPDELGRARLSAERERSIGVGVLGFHSYLQSKMIPFEGVMAKVINKQIFTNIKVMLDAANKELGRARGSCPDYMETESYPRDVFTKRFSHVMAVAPTASSSIIMGNTSPSIEPFSANCYRQDTLSGSYFKKNKHLDKLITMMVTDLYSPKGTFSTDVYEKLWTQIAANDGSIQGMVEFSQEEKDVFKTAMEIDQRWIVELAGDRAPLIDQGQSVNVFFRPNTNIKYLHTVHFQAWKKGIKALYYCRSDKLRKADKVSQQIERKIIEELGSNDDCLACSS